jgi:hypothetical protein
VINFLFNFDLVTPYRQLYKPGKKDTPSLKEACESLMLGTYDFHDAEVDVLATSALLEDQLEKHGSKSILLDYLHPQKRPSWLCDGCYIILEQYLLQEEQLFCNLGNKNLRLFHVETWEL